VIAESIMVSMGASMTKSEISDFIYCVACGRDLSDAETMVLCGIANVPYPPKQIQGKPAPVTLAITTKDNHGIHCN
jgi:hypothetical protein